MCTVLLASSALGDEQMKAVGTGERESIHAFLGDRIGWGSGIIHVRWWDIPTPTSSLSSSSPGAASPDQYGRGAGNPLAAVQGARAGDREGGDAERGRAQGARGEAEGPAHPQVRQAEDALRRDHPAAEEAHRG